MTTSVGTRELRVPRARVRDEETGETTEFRSELLPRYARQTREVDEAILGTYLSGANSRRIRKALKPLLGEEQTCSNIARRTHAVSSGVTTTGSSTPRTGSMLAKPMTSSSPSGRLSRRPSSEA